jgi:hypothetical protein
MWFWRKTINEGTRSAIKAFFGGFMMLLRKGKPDVDESEGGVKGGYYALDRDSAAVP